MIKTPPIGTLAGAFSVKGKNVAVTGGNRGIGLGISTAFAEAGANVAVLCRNGTSANEVAAGFAKHGGKYFGVACDVADRDSVIAAQKRVYGEFGKLDVLVNNAGVATTVDFFTEQGLSEWHRVIGTNLHGTANVIHEFVPAMRDAGSGGSVINITSIGAQKVSNAKEHANAPYHASKAGLEIFTKFLAVTLGDYGIRVNAIAPGPTHSDLDADLPKSAFAAIESMMPAHRFGEGLEIGALCVFLASPAGVQITGTVIPHDGGMMTVT
ncbi:MAG: SDR family oxidoreductase [Oscillospiraceae bacterium]|jgi:NAD(P)-dependent dehydrogenase (short-subunit alcohol dehydrogenase family)|nr:SDR family oxidoreductase [Oscillospiraceae bacterium]